jgi:hypothetical protein
MAMLLSDHATPDGNHFSAYGCHTFKWVNAAGESVFVKVCLLFLPTLKDCSSRAIRPTFSHLALHIVLCSRAPTQDTSQPQD